MSDKAEIFQEINFDGLVGPTHNFSGLAFGNLASDQHASQMSYPKKAALQGLDKMAALMKLGLPQGILPPHERPYFPFLRQLGFDSSPELLLPKLLKEQPALLAQVSSASAMWVANAATMTPSADTLDQKAHFTPANLSSMMHRSIEHQFTSRVLQHLFHDDQYFTHHPTLPSTQFFGDEGAANHTRFSDNNGQNGLHCFVYGQSFFTSGVKPKRFPARQTLDASQAIARQHGLSKDNTIFIQQNPDVIDQGVFHNDVIAVGSRNILLCHEEAFLNQQQQLATLTQLQENKTHQPFFIIEIKNQDISVATAVQAYLFNTQIVFTSQDTAVIIAPAECQDNAQVQAILDRICQEENPIKNVHYFDLRQSMNNGGGPACLRFRVTLNQQQQSSLTTNTLLTPKLYQQLATWINRHYRDELCPADLADPTLYRDNCQALDELTRILDLGANLYDFQRS